MSTALCSGQPRLFRGWASQAAALAALLLLALGPAASADHALTHGGREGGARAAALYVSIALRRAGTHKIDISAAFTSVNSAPGPAAASIIELPCPNQTYRFTADRSSLVSGAPHRYSATLVMGSAHLPPGVSCGRPIPSSFGDSTFTMKVTFEPPNGETAFTISGQRLPDGNLEGGVGHVTESLCQGRYRFDATFTTPSAHLRFSYPFRLTNVKGAPECNRPKGAVR